MDLRVSIRLAGPWSSVGRERDCSLGREEKRSGRGVVPFRTWAATPLGRTRP